MLKTYLNSKKIPLTVTSSRDGNWIKIHGNEVKSSSLFFIPKGQPISISEINGAINITSGNMSFDVLSASQKNGEKIIQQLQAGLQGKGSLASKIIKTGVIGLSILVAYIVIGAGFQAREMLSAQQTQNNPGINTQWKSNPDDLDRSIEEPNSAAKTAPASNIDQLLTQAPVMPEQQDLLAKSIYEGAVRQGQRDFAQAVPPSTSTSGLDQFGLAAPATGCDPSLAFDKK